VRSDVGQARRARGAAAILDQPRIPRPSSARSRGSHRLVPAGSPCGARQPVDAEFIQRMEDVMLIVRNCFVAKPGHGSKLAALIKEAAVVGGLTRYRVLTDLTGDFNRVVLEYEAENLGEFEMRMREYETNEAFRAKMKGYTDLYVSGSREILRVA
jgi:hypothetical protein